ncbi:MAG: ATPase [Aestuariivita sp.]|nr:ATPase [Aestuariivita sp.]MCY4347050.1 ATPase [Aestuariivita sp.]
MLYNTPEEWLSAEHKRVTMFGMSGLGKTRMAMILSQQYDWYHYSVDYRIGSHYMGKYIVDNAVAEAKRNPTLRELLETEAISIQLNVGFMDLTPVSCYLGKPGNSALGGLPIDEYRRRQEQFRCAEVKALLDTEYFLNRACQLHGQSDFICDTGGSICEWVDPHNPNDPILSQLAEHTLLIWLKGGEYDVNILRNRFDEEPKPMAYRADFLTNAWETYLEEHDCVEDSVDPDAFIRWTYERSVSHRQPIYQAMSNWGVTIPATNLGACLSGSFFEEIVAEAIEQNHRD